MCLSVAFKLNELVNYHDLGRKLGGEGLRGAIGARKEAELPPRNPKNVYHNIIVVIQV